MATAKKIILALLLSLTMTKGLAPATPDWLDAWYRGYNVALFDSELPDNVIIDHNYYDDENMAITIAFNLNGIEHYRLAFNKRYEPSGKQGRETLIHEMCHVQMMVEKKKELDSHGPLWQSCMHRVANKNGFESLW